MTPALSQINPNEISGSLDGEYEDSFLGYGAM
jgi:hypothetical protein